MDYRIVEKEDFSIVGKGIRTTTINGENLRRIPAFWDEINGNGVSDKLEKSYGAKVIYGACMEFDKEQEKLTYFIGVESDRKSSFDWEEKVIPASTWAVFPVIGPIPDAIQKVWERIFAEWFPATGYEHAGGPELEVYPIDGDITAEDHHCEVWVPIVKK